jgi:hypothetical protein
VFQLRLVPILERLVLGKLLSSGLEPFGKGILLLFLLRALLSLDRRPRKKRGVSRRALHRRPEKR